MLAWRSTAWTLKDLHRQTSKAKINTTGTCTLEGGTAATATLHDELEGRKL